MISVHTKNAFSVLKLLSSKTSRAIWASGERGRCVLDCMGPTGTPRLMSYVVVTLRDCCELQDPWFLHLSNDIEKEPSETWTNILSNGEVQELPTLLFHLAWKSQGKLCRKPFLSPDFALPGKLEIQVFRAFLSPQDLSRWRQGLGFQRSQGLLSLPSLPSSHPPC